jgi:NADPH:quinone reductase-like Zn-dependent oxidoreductase
VNCMSSKPTNGLELRSLVTENGELELSLVDVPIPTLQAGEILVRIEAAPLNPADQNLLLSGADLGTMRGAGTPQRPVARAIIPEERRRGVAGRFGQSLGIGLEGAGTVISAAPDARALMGKTVAMFGGSMFAQYRCLRAADVLVLPDDASANEGASSFVNPLTALGIVATARREGRTALVNTAAASNLGQMVNRICLADGMGLVNIVRSPEQIAMLRSDGAVHVCDTSAPTFTEDLVDALAATGATVAFDPIGGGNLIGRILAAMEVVASRSVTGYSPYGSSVFKQVYVYGGLDPRPTELTRNFGHAWGLAGWSVNWFVASLSPEEKERIYGRIRSELKTTFASNFSHEISLRQALDPAIIGAYARRATGEKYLIKPAI